MSNSNRGPGFTSLEQSQLDRIAAMEQYDSLDAETRALFREAPFNVSFRPGSLLTPNAMRASLKRIQRRATLGTYGAQHPDILYSNE